MLLYITRPHLYSRDSYRTAPDKLYSTLYLERESYRSGQEVDTTS